MSGDTKYFLCEWEKNSKSQIKEKKRWYKQRKSDTQLKNVFKDEIKTNKCYLQCARIHVDIFWKWKPKLVAT